MSIVIVGHGPSLYGMGRGRVIDAFNEVVRLKNQDLSWQRKEDFGEKTSILVTNTRQQHLDCPYRSDNVWTYTTKPYPVIGGQCCDSSLKEWSARLREVSTMAKPIFTCGAVATLLVAEILRPYKITLAGFDNLLPGIREEYQGAYDQDPHVCTHDLPAERRILWEMQDKYGIALVPL